MYASDIQEITEAIVNTAADAGITSLNINLVFYDATAVHTGSRADSTLTIEGDAPTFVVSR